MQIIIDGDACPNIERTNKLAEKNQIPVLIFCDTTHQIKSTYAKVITVDKGFQSVDLAIANVIKVGDILITQDYGLALLGLFRHAKVMSPTGNVYETARMDFLLEQVHQSKLLRKQNIHLKGPKKRNREDDQRMIKTLEKLIQNEINKPTHIM